MYPILLEWNGIVIPAWHFFFALGAIGALYLFQYLNDISAALTHRQVSHFYIVSYIGGYVGARFLSILIDEEHDSIFSSLSSLFELGAMTFYGGFIGCALAAIIFSYITKTSFKEIADIAVPSGFLGLAVGRIGCFLNGDDFGKAIELSQGQEPPWWSVTFPNLNDGIYRVPSQLIEVVAVGLIVWASVIYFRKRYSASPGLTGVYAAIAYAIYRFLAEFLRGDPRGWVIDQILTPSQFVSLIIFVLSGLIYSRIRYNQGEN